MKRILCLVLLFVLPLCGCASNQSQAQRWSRSVSSTVRYDEQTGELDFLVPKPPEDYRIRILVSGRIRTETGGMSWHAFEQESESGDWEYDRPYTTTIDPKTISSLSVHIALERDGSYFGETNVNYSWDDAGSRAEPGMYGD